ncbi:MAG TPA: hypothetical protein PLL33_03905 [Paracoccus sp. (in: a-proteobacteria)]|nr:hypothetical protein [Paracoccus sp. (in: a-proteobacteria)]
MQGKFLKAFLGVMLSAGLAGPAVPAPKGSAGIQAAPSGIARCLPTSAQVNAAAASATNQTRARRGLTPVAASK